jgi:ABC-type multidrug transport system ATPase subunit
MKTQIIALYGRSNIGKTTTLKLVVEKLKKLPNATFQVFTETPDIKVIITIGKTKIGIESQGDPDGRLEESLDYFIRVECDVIICATRTWGATTELVKNRAKPENIHWIKKFSGGDRKEDQDRSDLEKAAEILALVSIS